MSTRKEVFVTGNYYHIYNRATAGIPIFGSQRAANFFLNCAQYYCSFKPPAKYSIYRQNKEKYNLKNDKKLVTILSYCVMPNHFHFQLRQDVDGGVNTFIRKLTSSFAHYYSVRNNLNGHVFQGNFKAVHVESDEYLLHLSRYIHLNPSSSSLVIDPKEYRYSSLKTYIESASGNSQFVDTSIILGLSGSSENYLKFVMDQKDYQRRLKIMRYLFLE